MTLPYHDFTKVRCPICDRRIAGVPSGDGIKLIAHASRAARSGDRGTICEASERLIVRDRSGSWRLER